MAGLPRLIPIRQNFPDRSISDVRSAVEREMRSSGLDTSLKPGAQVAIGVGSRGISNIATIVRAVVDYWKSAGCRPFLFPAMGSHGAATAEGQADVLAHYGIHEATMGCPVISQLEVVPLGRNPEGIETFMDRRAFESDGVFLVNRVKWHTDFAGKIESGLFKMMAIGLGKFAGAQHYHVHALKIGLEAMVLSVGRMVLRSGKIMGGLAIVEDANHETAGLWAVPADAMESREQEILTIAKSWMGRLPFALDVLTLDEIGKTYSGAGMDTKVVNRGIDGEYNPWDTAPRIERIYVRGVSPLSYGNAVGLGMADVIHERMLKQIDWNPTLINSLTSGRPAAIRTPIHFASDRECLERLGLTVGKFELSEVTFGWIPNSLEISRLAVSENLLAEVRSNPMLEILGPAQPMPFNAAGDLPDCEAFLGTTEAAQVGN
jgi:hypothetical protein